MDSPGLEEFLQAPIETVRETAPATMIFAAGGTRRSAVLAGVSTTGQEYARWAYNQMIDCFEIFFEHGVQHIITHAIIPTQYKEVTPGYREKMLGWIDTVLAGPEAMRDYQRRGWRTRLWGAENIPGAEDIARRLRESPAADDAPMLCFTITAREEDSWTSLFTAVRSSGAQTQTEAIRAQFGDAIPPVTLYIGSGKPGVFPAVLPPVLMGGNVACYWTQRPGFVSAKEVRAILYDYAFTRRSWQQDKSGRAEQVLSQRRTWEQAPILGLGKRLGPFWFPGTGQPEIDE